MKKKIFSFILLAFILGGLLGFAQTRAENPSVEGLVDSHSSVEGLTDDSQQTQNTNSVNTADEQGLGTGGTAGSIQTTTPPSATATTNTTSNSGTSGFFGDTLNVYLENVYLWSIGVAGLLAIIMLMYAGYQYATSQGNPEQINQAKEIIIGALAGLALLIIAALVVQAMGLGGNQTSTNNNSTTSTVSGNNQELAKQILTQSRITLSVQDQNRVASSAKQNITDVSQGKCAKRDDGTCVTLNNKMLSAITAAGEAGYKFQVNWIAGGGHASTSYHYCGSAFDMYPSENYETMRSFFVKYGTVESLHEDPGGSNEHYHFAWTC